MKEAGRYLWDVRTPMRDGVDLSTDLYLPPAGLSGGPYPLVLLRTPDNNQQAAPLGIARHLADNGYAVALQDVRGRHDSAGTFSPFRGEGEDGYDAVEWLAGQDWCTGRVGMMGAGYAGFAQWAAAAERPPHLVTLVSTSPLSGPYHGGLLRLPLLAWLHKVSARVWQEGSQVDWDAVLSSLPLSAMDHGVGRPLPLWQEWLASPADADRLDGCTADLPVLHITGWYDDERRAALALFERQASRGDQSLLIGPWDHDGVVAPRQSLGGVDFGATSVTDLCGVHLSWFDQWLKDVGDVQPAVRCFVTGLGEWRDLTAWPPPATPTAYHLRGDGRLTPEEPGEEPADRYAYDPDQPVLATSDVLFFPTPPARPVEPPLDRRFLERRADAVAWTTDELGGDLDVVGAVAARLFLSCDRPDTDWVLELTDVSPGGPAVLVARGAVRARYREGLDREVLLQPDQMHEVGFDLGSVAHVFRRGHRVRLTLTSSLFPLYSRNLNSGGALAEETEPVVARTSVRHDPAHLSALLLPVSGGGDDA